MTITAVRGKRRDFSGALQDFQAADVSHSQVGDDQVVAALGNHGACGLAAWRLVDLIVLRAQHLREHAVSELAEEE